MNLAAPWHTHINWQHGWQQVVVVGGGSFHGLQLIIIHVIYNFLLSVVCLCLCDTFGDECMRPRLPIYCMPSKTVWAGWMLVGWMVGAVCCWCTAMEAKIQLRFCIYALIFHYWLALWKFSQISFICSGRSQISPTVWHTYTAATCLSWLYSWISFWIMIFDDFLCALLWGVGRNGRLATAAQM